MPADALAPKVTSASAGMLLAMWAKERVMLFQSQFHLLGSSQNQGTIQNVNLSEILLKQLSVLRVNYTQCISMYVIIHLSTAMIILLSAQAMTTLQWRLKSPASRLFTQTFVQALYPLIKENTIAPRHWPLWGEFTGDRWTPLIKASNAENVSVWWRHHALVPISYWPGTQMGLRPTQTPFWQIK